MRNPDDGRSPIAAGSEEGSLEASEHHGGGPPLSEALARIVRERRRELRISQEEVARRMGTSQAQVSRIEDPRKASGATLGTIERLAGALGIEFFVTAGEAVGGGRGEDGGRVAVEEVGRDREGRRGA